MNWHSYRPDILGILKSEKKLKIVIVECETKPNRNRVLKKTLQIKRVLSLQKQLNEHHFVLPLLAIPALNLHKINFLDIFEVLLRFVFRVVLMRVVILLPVHKRLIQGGN